VNCEALLFNKTMKPSSIFLIVILVILLVVCCVCLVGITAGSVYLYKNVPDILTQMPTDIFGPTPTVVINRPPLETIPTDTLTTLENTVIPNNDMPAIACRLLTKCNLPATLPPPTSPLKVGDQGAFWVSNMDTNENTQITASLRSISAHVYFWVEDGVEYKASDLEAMTTTFENKIYPTTREFFGSEWTPGIDGDPHIYILYATGLGSSIAGYYSSADEYNPLVHEYSNAHEMFIFNADNSALDDLFTYGVLAHEFQHMIHWNVDRDESSWLNEGFSELSAFLNGYDIGGFDYLYTSNTDLQLNDWPDDRYNTSAHYGAGFLFTSYFLDRFGEQATRALVANPLNGLESIDNTLVEIKATDPLTGKQISADDLFMDWAITNYLQDGSVADGRYTYHNNPDAPQAAETETISNCPLPAALRSVYQYGVDTIRINCPGNYTLHFEGSTVTNLLPENPYSGDFAFWSNKGDESDMTLTREFDLTQVSSPITMTFQTWYYLEQDFDYLYLEASTDGKNWQILHTPSGTDQDLSGNSFGWAYNGKSNSWIQENIDLSQFAGQKVSLRFEYITDAAVNGEGFLLDDISIPAIGYFSNFETDSGGWQPEGFARIQNTLPQTFRLALILKGSTTTIQMIPLSPDQSADIPLTIGGDIQEVILVVSGMERFTIQKASYQFEIR
jgi:immune inhibitor A